MWSGGGGGGGGGGFGKVANAVSGSAPASVAVGTAVGVLAATVPVIGTAAVAYQAGKMVYDAVKAGSSLYQRTGDSGAALGAVGKSLVKSGAEAVAGQALGTAVDVGWKAMKPALGVKTSAIQDKVITAAAAATIQEEASRWKKKKHAS